MNEKLKKWILPILFTLAGAVIGLMYYALIGCASGSCAIASNPVYSMAYMGLIGLLLSGVFGKNSDKASCSCYEDKEVA